MKRMALLAVALIAAQSAQAHRLDEYLQAARIGVTTNRLTISLDLTPGVAMVDRLYADIDRDRDDQVSVEEANAYARRLLDELSLTLDGQSLQPGPPEIVFPSTKAARAGTGVIRLKFSARLENLALGEHEFKLVNKHLPAVSVYLANVLVPEDDAIRIVRQERNKNQSEYRLRFARQP